MRPRAHARGGAGGAGGQWRPGRQFCAVPARWRRDGDELATGWRRLVTIWRVRAVMHWWLCPRDPVGRALGAMPSGALGAVLPVLVALGAMLPALLALLLARCPARSCRCVGAGGHPAVPATGSAWARYVARGAWRGACRLFGCRGPKKRRRSADTCGPPGCW